MKLLIIHSHYRPGGVRRVIELAAPSVVQALGPRLREVVLVGGEPPPDNWLRGLAAALGRRRLTVAVEPAVGYVSEQKAPPEALAARIRRHLGLLLAEGGDAVVWAHNLGLGRNLPLARVLGEECAARGVPLVLHHHDWWFDNRWARWPEMQAAGFRGVDDVAATILPVHPQVRHATINQEDAGRLQRHFGSRARWIPNLATPAAPPSAASVRRARAWLRERLGDDAPVWLLPCRLLRRKNFAEALLLTRWLRPEGWLVTTGGASSADEAAYAEALHRAARRQGWRLRLSVLAGEKRDQPSVPELLAASEAVLLTSLQEGFGLPNLEAAAAGRPLLHRSLDNIEPDLLQFGFRFPQSYHDVKVATALFDYRAERTRQGRRFRAWKAGLPAGLRNQAGEPWLLRQPSMPAAVPFSRLTLTAQLEVLSAPAEESWAACARWNLFLPEWRERAAAGRLEVSRWPRSAEKWLGPAAYARHFRELIEAEPGDVSPDAGVRAARAFVRAKLSGANQYPLLWSAEP